MDLPSLIGAELAAVLERLDEGILVLDRERSLRFLNPRARALLGYAEGDVVGGRCRHSTQGVDCETACPLSFALQSGQKVVEQFSTVYNGKAGQPVALAVTVIPLRDEDGGFRGAVEILRPTEADLGFYACGRSARAQRLRREIERLSQHEGTVFLVGEEPACDDVAEAVHRASGLDSKLFFRWGGSWDQVPLWPPGSMYAFGDPAHDLVREPPPPAWRVVVGCERPLGSELAGALDDVHLELPTLEELAEDLPRMVVDLTGRLKPALRVAPDALQRLVELAREEGIVRLCETLRAAVVAADGCLTEEHLPPADLRSLALAEVLESPEPLAALEHRILEEVLVRCGWRMQEAADRLGISRVTLWRKLKEHGIERPC